MGSYEIRGQVKPDHETVLTPQALAFVTELAERFAPKVRELLAARRARQAEIDAGKLPGFLPETRELRDLGWIIAELPEDLQDRRVEILGPADRRTIVESLNSGASVFIADFEDALSPTWDNVIEGQQLLRQAVRGELVYDSREGERQRLVDDPATLAVRPRGWHLPEKHLLVGGQSVPGALVDFGLYFFHNAKALIERGSGPYFSLPKLENHREAHVWTSVFEFAENRLGLHQYSIKATALIETLPAAFEIDEILYVLKDYLVGLECGPTDYLFSFIKTLHKHSQFVLPDRNSIDLATPFLRAYYLLAIKSAHRRGILAIGGQAAQMPIADDPGANQAVLASVREQKTREVADGQDGTWVAHPDLVPVAAAVFDEHLPGPNQLGRLRRDVNITAADLLRMPEGAITEEGMRDNVSVALRYLGAWLGGEGCVPLGELMEDTATAEIARSQLWVWIHRGAVMDDGNEVTMELFETLLREELQALRETLGDAQFDLGPYPRAADLLDKLTRDEELAEFFTTAAYPLLP